MPKEQATQGESTIETVDQSEVYPRMFLYGAIVGDIETVDCTLRDGTRTFCYQFIVAGAPA